MKINILQLILKNKIVSDDTEARGLILAGKILIDDKVIDKPGLMVPENSKIRIRNHKIDVARSAAKIRPAFTHWKINIENLVTMDIGSSTGGFVQVLLENNPLKIFAVDVGYGLLDSTLRNCESVTVLERTRIEDLTSQIIGTKIQFFTMDVSFTSILKVLPSVYELCEEGASGLVLLKPQFEISKHLSNQYLENGILVDTKMREHVITNVITSLPSKQWNVQDRHPAFLSGTKGNLEEILFIKKVN